MPRSIGALAARPVRREQDRVRVRGTTTLPTQGLGPSGVNPPYGLALNLRLPPRFSPISTPVPPSRVPLVADLGLTGDVTLGSHVAAPVAQLLGNPEVESRSRLPITKASRRYVAFGGLWKPQDNPKAPSFVRSDSV